MFSLPKQHKNAFIVYQNSMIHGYDKDTQRQLCRITEKRGYTQIYKRTYPTHLSDYLQ